MKHAYVVVLLLLTSGLTSPASADQATGTAVLRKTASSPGSRSMIEQHCIMVAAKAETEARAKKSDDPVGAAETALKNCRVKQQKHTASVDPKPAN